MPGGSILLEQTRGFLLQVYSNMYKILLLPCIKALVIKTDKGKLALGCKLMFVEGNYKTAKLYKY